MGSGHAALALRADWQQQMSRIRSELGFRSVRFHGLLCDDMSAYTGAAPNPYSFHNADLIFDFLLSIGMKPFVELSFMPRLLASGPATIFNYQGNITPPKSYSGWAELIEHLARHLVNRYGIRDVSTWNFEVWNEPNLEYFWSGTQQEYFQLYEAAAKAIKSVDVCLRVGGPSTAANAWVDEMLQFCRQSGAPIDFISTHHYPTDVALGHNLDMETSMSKVPRGVLANMARQVRQQVGKIPLYYTEWSNSPSSRDPYHDGPYSAAFIMKTIADNSGIVDLYSYWTFSDIFEELNFCSTPFHGGFGLLNIHGIPKPSYQAFRLLHLLGEERVSVMPDDPNNTVECLVTRKGGTVGIVLYNHHVPLAQIKAEAVHLQLNGVRGFVSAKMCRIDEEHLNPRRAWLDKGEKEYLTQGEIADLIADTSMTFSPVTPVFMDDTLMMEFHIPPHGVVGIFIETSTLEPQL